MGEQQQTAAPGSETPASETAPTGETPTQQQGTGETPGTTTTTAAASDATREIESLKAALKKANAEAASHRVKANELDTLKQQIETEKLSETEKLNKKLAELQSAHDTALRTSQERIIAYEVKLQAASMGIVDPDAAAKLLDWSQIEYDDAGSPQNVDALLKELVKAKPYLSGKAAATPASAGGATNPSRSQSSGNQPLSWDMIGKMTAADYNARRAEIQAWMQQNPHRR